ncbi:MAG: SNF2 helicase associated domain-containing protein [Lentisphaerae bacterium]|nr:SNF2 helicase associated domain-containing protein [Lentisphaerota bacterium]
MLIDWAGAEVVRDAESSLESGNVLSAEFDPPYIRGSVLANNRELTTSLKLLASGMVQSDCPCYTNQERGLICTHVIALALMLIKRATDPLREAKYLAEKRQAERLAGINESDYIQRVSTDTPGAIPADLRVTLAADWQTTLPSGTVTVLCELVVHRKRTPIDAVKTDTPFSFSKTDENLLFVLEDIAEGPARHELELRLPDLTNILRLHAGRIMPCDDGTEIQVGETPMQCFLRMDLDRENGEVILMTHTELPFVQPGEFPLYIVAGREAWVYGGQHLWPLASVLPGPYHAIYREPIIVPRSDVMRFLKQELPAIQEHTSVESDISIDLFSVDPAAPAFRLLVRGSPASLSAVLYAIYDDIELVANKPDARSGFALPDPNDLMRYEVRNFRREQIALEQLRTTGFVGECGDDLTSIVSKREVMNFLGSQLPALRRLGWRVDMEGRVTSFLDELDFVAPVAHIQPDENAGWFDVSFDFEDMQGASVSAAEIQLALRKGESFVERNGRTLLIDSDAVESMTGVFEDCSGRATDQPGHFRVSDVYAPFVQSSLDALDGVDIEAESTWRQRSSKANRTTTMEPVTIAPPLDGILRPYQKSGVAWIRFMETNGFGALLADEMGLGKTLQTLTWLQLDRTDPEARHKPTLVVCPTSLVGNWAAEARKFTPHLKVLLISGKDRHELWDQLATTDIAVTSYALLRRDLEHYRDREFSALILDEAQHIKNRATRNAIAAKQIRARNRLVLTGTPMENSVSDLWSIMDFLMPGYMGEHDVFRHFYEQPIARGGREAEAAQTKLRRKLQPFLLRRLKVDVAKDLPKKIERISTCQLSPDQLTVYKELLDASRRKITSMVSKKGFNQSRMEILTLLMRLRQTCCHLDLLKLDGLKAKRPSSKMDQCFELLDEAIDGGHRVLIFSQFVSMLHILRNELEHRRIEHCYLDGSTKDRMAVVHRFNTDRNVPIFLISLKAGGTGLNLTGADMVIHFDPWWNPAVENQATDRAHRIGQLRTVYSVKLITEDTVEEKVLAMQQKKRAIIDATVESDEQAMKSMSWEDIESIFDL